MAKGDHFELIQISFIWIIKKNGQMSSTKYLFKCFVAAIWKHTQESWGHILIPNMLWKMHLLPYFVGWSLMFQD